MLTHRRQLLLDERGKRSTRVHTHTHPTSGRLLGGFTKHCGYSRRGRSRGKKPIRSSPAPFPSLEDVKRGDDDGLLAAAPLPQNAEFRQLEACWLRMLRSGEARCVLSTDCRGSLIESGSTRRDSPRVPAEGSARASRGVSKERGEERNQKVDDGCRAAKRRGKHGARILCAGCRKKETAVLS